MKKFRVHSSADLEALSAAVAASSNSKGSRRITQPPSHHPAAVFHYDTAANTTSATQLIYDEDSSSVKHQQTLSTPNRQMLGFSLEDGDMPPPPSLPTPTPLRNRRCRSDSVAATPATTPDSGSSGNTNRNVSNSRAVAGDSSPARLRKLKLQQLQVQQQLRIFDDPAVTAGYASVPLLEQVELPRGGVSVDTVAAGRVQFGIPPETIKDSMLLGIEVPRIYIVPRERFCSDWGPALGINLAEFEFPAYFNWFVRQKKCCLVVDSAEAEHHIRTVFEETLLGPKMFRNLDNPLPHDEEDFDPDFPMDARPNFFKEFQYFRTAEKTAEYEELNSDMLLDFYHFEKGNGSSRNLNSNTSSNNNKSGRASLAFSPANEFIGVPPLPRNEENEEADEEDSEWNLGDLIADETDRFVVSRGADFNRSLGNFHMAMLRDAEPAASARKTTRFAENLPPRADGHHGGGGGSSKASRRASLESVESLFSTASSNTVESMRSDTTTNANQQNWLFSQIQWLGEVATVWPKDATPQQVRDRSVPRVEIFKMPGSGIEYVIHDVDANNVIIGKARLRGTVRVPDEISVEGFLSESGLDGLHLQPDILVNGAADGMHDPSDSSLGVTSIREHHLVGPVRRPISRALFHPPSFGVTVLGNSHGFDKNGSTSGFVLWINGRGIMIDPPPYSSATLEREGIRPQMIFGVMITHCHADHDAGAFQKVLTGSRLSVITTPSIYKSFIRKYSALSGLSPSLLQHSHRFRSAIIGRPLNFQGATFHFTYTLHTIPCISFKVEWRGRSIVFTGDHLNLPPLLDELEQKGVLSKGRADSLRQMPLQDCDVLLHEAGAPPIHTPLAVLQNLPLKIRERLYVVHTAGLPPDSGLRVAPTGTSGTIRLDEIQNSSAHNGFEGAWNNKSGISLNPWSNCAHADEYGAPENDRDHNQPTKYQSAPEVMNRPACISDAWFMLNLISNIPFFASLSYINTMEVLEVAHIDVFSAGEIVVPARKRHGTLCVIWEGTCTERESETVSEFSTDTAVWHAGDWTGPVALQPNADRAAKSAEDEHPKDVVAISAQGVKVITISMMELNGILMRGSKLYRKYVGIEDKRYGDDWVDSKDVAAKAQAREENPTSRHVLFSLKINSLLGNLYAGQIRSLESIAEGPHVFEAGTFLWKAGGRCDCAFLIADGSAAFRPAPGRTRSIGYERSWGNQPSVRNVMETTDGNVVDVDKVLHDLPPESEFARLELLMALRAERMEADPYYHSPERAVRKSDHKHSDRNTNRVFARLYASRKAIDGLVVSRGCFLSDTSRMVSGELVHETDSSAASKPLHSTTLIVGQSGCVAWVFPCSTFLPFLETNPGVLLSLLGTQVMV